MDDLLKAICLSNMSAREKSLVQFYKKLSEFKVNTIEDKYLLECLLPKIYSLIGKKHMRKDILYLSLIANENIDILHKCIEYEEKTFKIDLNDACSLFDYCVYKNEHWFYEVINDCKSFVYKSEISQIVNMLRLLQITNLSEVDIEKIENLLFLIKEDELDEFWKYYIQEVKHVIDTVQFCKKIDPLGNQNDIFLYSVSHDSLEVFSNYLCLDKLDCQEVLPRLSNCQNSEKQIQIFMGFTLIADIFKFILSSNKDILKNHNINFTIERISKKITEMPDKDLQLELLENIFAIIFLKSNQITKEGESTFVCKERETRLILHLIKSVLDEIKLKSQYEKDSDKWIRFTNLNKYVTDAMWRMELVVNVKSSLKLQANLLPYMLASPESLVFMCLNCGDFQRAYQVIKTFNLENSRILHEIKYLEKLQNLKKTLQKTFKIKSIKKENPNISSANIPTNIDKTIEDFFRTNPVYPNSLKELIIEEHIGESPDLVHLKNANETFMNLLDLAISQPTSKEDSEVMLQLAYENNTLSHNVESPYSNFCKKILTLFNEIGTKNNLSVAEILLNPHIHLDLEKYNKEEELYGNLSQLYDEFCINSKLEEPGSLNSSHLTHKTLHKINKLCNEFVEHNFGTSDNIKYLSKLFNYLKAFSRVLYIEQNSSDIVSQGKNTSYFELLNYNRSELMGKLLFERDLDPSEFEKYFGRLKLDYLYHVIGNCFPTINLHTYENVTEEELYHENSLYIPSKSIITYIQKRNWLLAFILNEMYNVEGVKIDISEVRIQTFLNYMNLQKIKNLGVLFDGNKIITALQNDISTQKITSYVNKQILKHEEMLASQMSTESNESLETGEEIVEGVLKSTNWKALYDVVSNIPENQLNKKQELMDLKDMILINLVQDAFEIDYYKYVQFINDTKKRINTILDNFKKWPGEFCIHVIKSEMSNFNALDFRDFHELKDWLNHVELCEQINHLFPFQSWSKCYELCKEDPGTVLSKLLLSNRVGSLLKFIELYDLNEDLLVKIDEEYMCRVFELKEDTSCVKNLLDKLPLDHSIKVCYNLLKLLKKLHNLQFVVNYILNNTEDESLKNVEISLKMLAAFTSNEQDQLLCLIYDPLNIVEILIMNTKLDKLATVLDILKSEIMHTEYDENSICVEKIDELLRKYAEKSLDFRVITQPNPRLLRTPECKLMQSLDSLNLGPDRKQFVMPEEVPTKDEWVQNNEVLECMCCQQVTFSMFNRRHHCRRCGRIICYNCSLKRMLVPTYGDILVRVCSDCYAQTSGESLSSEMSDTLSTKSILYDYWLLTDDPDHNRIVREEFSYEHAPSVSLCLSLLKYHSKSIEYPQFLLEQCDAMLRLLYPCQEPLQEIDYLLVIKMLKSLAMAAKMSSVECTMHYGASLAERILSQAELLALLAERGCLNLLPVSPPHLQNAYIDASMLRRLRDRLLEREQWNLALEVSTKAGLDNTGIFAAWGKSCLKAGSLMVAREKFQRCLDKSSYYEHTLDISINSEFDDSAENITRSRQISKSSNFSGTETKPVKNPPLLTEIIQILELNTRKIDLDVLKQAESNRLSGSVLSLNQSFTLANQPDVAISILNKLKNLKAIASGTYFESAELKSNNLNTPVIDPIFYDECAYYLTKYGTHLSLLEFYIKHEDFNKALMYILGNNLSTDIFNDIYMRCLKDGVVNVLLSHMTDIDSTLDVWKEYLRQICRHLEKQNMLNSLYQIQQYMGDYVRAAMTCIRFYQENVSTFTDLVTKVNFLRKAEEHFRLVFDEEQWVEVATVVRKLSNASNTSFEEKGLTSASLVMKMNPKTIEAHIRTIWTQNEIAQFLAECESFEVKPIEKFTNMLMGDDVPKASEKSVQIPTLFGSSLEKMYLAVLAIICGKNVECGFPIALKIIQDYKLKPIKIYCQAGKQLAKSESYTGIAQLVSCIKTSDTNDTTVADMCDEMLTLAVATFTKANVTGTKVEDLIKLISDRATKISAYIEAKQLKTAYFLAVKYKRMSDIRRILREAELLNQPSIKSLCQKVLQSHSHAPSQSRE